MTEDENCSECSIAVGLGLYLNICKELDTKETCDELFKKVTNDEISPEDLFKLIKDKARDKPEKLEMLKYIDELVEKGAE